MNKPTGEEQRKYRYSWYRDDIEAKLGMRGTRFTRANGMLWGAGGLLITLLFYVALSPFPDTHFNQMFTQRGAVQYVEVLFSFWALLLVIVKWRKTKLQRKALEFTDLVPVSADFVLSPATVGQVLHRLHEECDDPSTFILFNRIELALSNLKNMGQIGEVDGVLQSQAGNDEDVMESSYSLVKGLIWAVPVLGFIGTVQGLSSAIAAFGGVLKSTSDISALKPALHGVTAGLATAFETTFVALVAALGIQLLLVVVRKREEELLDECKNYCQRHIIGRLRMMPFDRG